MAGSAVISEQAVRSTHPAMRVRPGAVLTTAAALVFVAGLISAAGGLWFVLGDHPFYHAGGYASDVGMTRAQVEAFNPRIAEWMLHVSHQVGVMSLGWGLFVMLLAATGLRRGQPGAWWTLALAGLPTLVLATFAEADTFGSAGTGTLMTARVLVVFLVGLLLPVRAVLVNSARR